MKIYLSGPISDICQKQAVSNFKEGAKLVEGLGHIPISPLVIPYPPTSYSEHESWLYYMKNSVKIMMDCDAMLCLENWHDSKGATLERQLFFDLGLPVFYYHNIREMIQKESPSMEWLHD